MKIIMCMRRYLAWKGQSFPNFLVCKKQPRATFGANKKRVSDGRDGDCRL